MRVASVGAILALIQTIHTEIMLVDDVGLRNSPRGSKTLSDVAQHLRRGYGDNVSIVNGFPSRGYVAHGPRVENYVPVSNMLRRFPVAARNPQAIPRILPAARPVPLAQGYKRPPLNRAYRSPPKKPTNTPGGHLEKPSSPIIPKPSTRPVYSPVLNPEISVAKNAVESHRMPKAKPASTKSNRKADSSEYPKGGDSSDYGAEIDTPEKDPVSDDLDALPPSKETTKQKTPKPDNSVKIDSPIKIDMPKDGAVEPTSEDVLKVAREISNVLVPRMRKKGYAKKHNSDIQSAGKARQSYLDYKLVESRESQKNIEKKLDALRELYGKISAKLKSLRDERDLAKTKIFSARSTMENSENTVKTLQEEISRNEGQIKLEEIEILKLERAINEERNKLSILTDQQKIYQSRLESFGSKEGTRREELKSNENRLKDYDRLLEQIEKDAENLRSRIAETETKRRLEIDTQNRLEIEKKEVEDSNHLSLFALYD